jgi:Zn-dependent peptidase ImmA (M78 family)
MRLPKTLVFPFGYRVKVKIVTPTEVAEENEGEPADGLWDAATRTIYLSSGVPLRRRRAVLIHEMFHAVADFQHQMLDDGVARN